MNLAEQLRVLESAQGSAALLALATVDLAYPDLPAAVQRRIKDALLAAAVPHWCDPAFLAAMLDTALPEADALTNQLSGLTVVEPFPARGERALNVHETARLALRDYLRKEDTERWI